MEEIINQLIDLVLQMKYLIGTNALVTFAILSYILLTECDKWRKKKHDTRDN